MVAWALVTSSILWGLALSAKLVRRKGVPAWLLDLHRHLGWLSIVFTAVHLLGLWADSFVSFGPREMFVPFASPWRARAVAWGIVAFYVLVAVEVTSWTKKWLPRRAWHAVHLTSFGLFATATVHAFLAGTDRTNVVVQWVVLTGTVMLVFMIAFRVSAPKRSREDFIRSARAPAVGGEEMPASA
jgi:DMSO/TMAO reductase YedYZ heme-binding membrane subunit